MKKSFAPLAALVGLAFLVSACGGGGGDSDPGATKPSEASGYSDSCGTQSVCPFIASSQEEIAIGMDRFLVGLLNNNDAPIADPDIKMHVKFFNLNKSDTKPAFERDMGFVWTVEPSSGLYLTAPEFDAPGPWGLEISVKGAGVDVTNRQQVAVEQSSATPEIGSKAPASDTLTSGDAKSLKEISTDSHPDPDFYELSVADAIEQHRPFVLVFATPKFCESQFCGPTLDKVKGVSKDFPDITFIHSEIYQGLEPTNDKGEYNPVMPAVKDWKLPSEPWVFVVDRGGKLVEKYETAFEPSELRTVLEKL